MSLGRQIPPSVVFPSPNEWPNTIRTITNLEKDSTTTVTSPAHGLTGADNNITSVTFMQVRGMRQINSITARVLKVIDEDQFIVGVNSTNFTPYSGGGVFSIVTGQPPYETVSFQTFNTPFYNLF